LKEIARKGIQVLYLTATLLPSEEAAFYKVVGVLEREMFTLQDCIVCLNIAYAVVRYKKKEEDKEVQ
jgi:ABC-type cobalt transport system substrate-binding protein